MSKKAEKILDSAVAYLILYGVKKATMDDIAGFANVSKVTIYKYFIDKETLYLETAKHIFSLYVDRIEHIAESRDALVEKMLGFIDTITDFSVSGHFTLCENLCAINLKTQDERNRYMQSYQQCLTSLIDQGLSEHLFQDGLNEDLIFHYINMGIVYFQQNQEYRQFILSDALFRQQFMQFHISRLFSNPESMTAL